MALDKESFEGVSTSIEKTELTRQELQQKLDAAKTQQERNELGQFATPPQLAHAILTFTRDLLFMNTPVRFLDPAFGTGSFYSAFLQTFPATHIDNACGYEIDAHYGKVAQQLWSATPLTLKLADFTKAALPTTECDRATLLVCNPPYVRHHHLEPSEKLRLQELVKEVTGVRLNGLSGLYCYFLLLAHAWLAEGGVACWLIPSEFMDVRYGLQVKQYLLHKITLLRIHRFDPAEVQFDDALVSSVLLWFVKAKPDIDHKVEVSYGGTLTQPAISHTILAAELEQSTKWTQLTGLNHHKQLYSNGVAPSTRLADLFTIKRGVATGGNSFFILTATQIAEHQLPPELWTPILPSPRFLSTDEITADERGNPQIDPQLFLLTCSLPEATVRDCYPTLWRYLQVGVERGIDQRYLAQHRTPWYAQEQRHPAPFLCTYMGRQTDKGGAPFRFMLNHSQAIAPNVYLMLYPKPVLQRAFTADPALRRTVWQILNTINPALLISEGRIYGGGLHKIEPKELANASAEMIMAILPTTDAIDAQQLSLF